MIEGKCLDYARNFNALFDSESILNLVAQHPEFILSYADHEQKTVLDFLSREFQVNSESLYLGAGTTDLLFTLPRILNKKRALVSVPTFWEYQLANERAGVDVLKISTQKETNFSPDLIEIESFLDNSFAVYVCNPNNPTSHLIDFADLQRIITNNPNVAFVIDETYMLFREDYQHRCLVQFSTQVKNLHVVTSFSKFFSIPGLRIGMLSSHPENIRKYRENTPPYLLSPLVDIVVPALFVDPDKNLEMRRKHTQLRKDFAERLREEFSGILKIFEPETNFILIEILSDKKSSEVARLLQSRDIYIRDGIEFEGLGNNWIRISVKEEKENQLLIQAMREIFLSDSI